MGQSKSKRNREQKNIDGSSYGVTMPVGLKWEGESSYSNSVIQMIYFLPKLRNAIKKTAQEKNTKVASMLADLFHKMETSKVAVATSKVKQKHKWEEFEDEQRLGCDGYLCFVTILKILNEEMENTRIQDLIPSLFQGELFKYTRCFDVDYKVERAEDFQTLPLDNSQNLVKSFREFLGPDILGGEFKVQTEIHGLQEGETGYEIINLPPILTIIPWRFSLKKVPPYEFPRILELDQFMKNPDPNDKATYVLHSLLIHRCKKPTPPLSDGRYHAFIDPKCDGNWIVFDNDLVEKSSEREMFQEGFGGTIHGETYRVYFFIYVRQSKIQEILYVEDEKMEGEKTERQ